MRIKQVQFYFRWTWFGIGFFYNPVFGTLNIQPLPMVGILIEFGDAE